MTVRKYSSRSQKTTLSASITSVATTANVVSGTSLMGGATLSAGQTYTVVIDPDTALEEIVDVTAVSTNTLTIVRGIDGSSAVAHSAGAEVRHMSIGRDFREANEHIENTTTVHGLTIANVLETTDTNMITTAMLQANAVTTAKITDANVTTAKIADSAVTSAKIADLTIATGDIADSAITSGKIATGAVGTTKIDDLSITTAKVVDSAVTAAKIASDAVTTAKILDANVTTAKIADLAITSAKIADGTIVAGDIADGAVTSAKILDSTIVNADISNTAAISLGKLATDPLARANHTGTQTASTISDFDTQVRTSRLDQMAAPTGSVSVNTQKITNLGTPTLSTDASTKAYVDTSINNLIGGAPATLDTLNEIAAALNNTANFSDTVVLKSGSTMTGALTLSGAPSSNLHAATKAYVDAVAGSATAAQAAQAAAEAAYDSFDDRYLGPKASAPTLDNDGNALLTGALYFNTAVNKMYVYNGSAWQEQVGTVSVTRWKKTAAGGETSLSGNDDTAISLSYPVGFEQVFLNGVKLIRNDDYVATTGTSITGLTALTLNDVVEVFAYSQFQVSNALVVTTYDAKGDLIVGSGNDAIGRLATGVDGYVLTADSSQTLGVKWAASAAGDVTLTGTQTLTNKTLTSPVINLGLNAQTGTTYTLTLADNGQLVTASNASAITITIPANSTTAFAIGAQVNIAQTGVGQVTIQGAAGVTINSTGATATAPKIRAQYGSATCVKTASDTWLVIGDIS